MVRIEPVAISGPGLSHWPQKCPVADPKKGPASCPADGIVERRRWVQEKHYREPRFWAARFVFRLNS